MSPLRRISPRNAFVIGPAGLIDGNAESVPKLHLVQVLEGFIRVPDNCPGFLHSLANPAPPAPERPTLRRSPGRSPSRRR